MSDVVRRARALVGTQFRPQGRDADTGLDCVGLVLCACDLPAEDVRRDYRLSGPYWLELERELGRRLRAVTKRNKRAGDVLLCAVKTNQLHLVIDCDDSFIHADASLRCVVETPGKPQWPVVGIFRRRRSRRKAN